MLLQIRLPQSTGPSRIRNSEASQRGWLQSMLVGSTNRSADRELIEELRRFSRGESYDEQAMPEVDSEALDFRAASELFAPVRKLKRADPGVSKIGRSMDAHCLLSAVCSKLVYQN